MFQQAFTNKKYLAALAAAQLQAERLREEYDVVLDPIETPAPVSARELRSLDTGNWANEWLFKNLVPEVIKKATSGQKVLITVVDTAWKPLSNYIKPYVLEQYGTQHVNETDADGHGHGHLCAGNMVAEHPTIPLGVVRELAKAGLLRVVLKKGLNKQGAGNDPNIGAAINSANALNVPGYTRHIVSMSFGGASHLPITAQAIAQGQAAGVFFSASAGNSGGTGNPSTVGFPARLPGVFNWGALDPSGLRAAYSSAGPELYGIAPGSQVLSTTNTATGLVAWSGTSSSNPIAAGLMACLLLMYPDVDTQAELDGLMRQYITDLGAPGRDVLHGWGAPVLTPYLSAPPTPPPPPPPAPEYEERELEVLVPLSIVMPWRRLSEPVGNTNRVHLDHCTVLWRSKKPADDYQQLVSRCNAYMGQIGLIIPDNWDWDQVVKWAGRFMQREIAKEFPGMRVKNITGTGIAEEVTIAWHEEEFLNGLQVMRKPGLWPVAAFFRNPE